MIDRAPGWDQREIKRVADDYFDGDRKMLAVIVETDTSKNNWQLSLSQDICSKFGSIEQFAERFPPKSRDTEYPYDPIDENIWDRGYSILFTSFWGWSPETWGTVGWSGQRGLSRRKNLLAQLTDPFITVCYVTSNVSNIDPTLRGRIAGFYLVSHETGDRDEFTHPIHYGRDAGKWRHSLRALRAFSYLPEHRLRPTDLDPEILARARSVSAMGEIISDPHQIALLRDTPWTEVEVFQPSQDAPDVEAETGTRGMVQAGPASSGGYFVSGGTQYLPRELYILRMDGDLDAYLGNPASGRKIIKVGLSASPDLRRQSFQKAMPRGAFNWAVERTTQSRGLSPYPSHSVAVHGEYAMKRYLAAHAEWLGGEFYLASEEMIEAAWQAGCDAAKFMNERRK